MNRAARATILLAAVLSSAGCAGFQENPWVDTQRWPGPMPSKHTPLPPGEGELHPPGPEEVRILRHADPVQVRTAGNSASAEAIAGCAP